MSEPEFVSISEASRALGVDARQVRRWVDRLDDSDKSSDMSRKYRGVPIVTVRMSALKALQNGGSEPHVEAASGESDSDNRTGQQFGRNERPVRTSQRPNFSEASLREIIERQDAEIKRLADALAASQQIASQAQQLQLIAERKVGELEGKLLPAMEQKEASVLTGDAQSEVLTSGGTIDRPEIVKAPWWAFWKGRGSSSE